MLSKACAQPPILFFSNKAAIMRLEYGWEGISPFPGWLVRLSLGRAGVSFSLLEFELHSNIA